MPLEWWGFNNISIRRSTTTCLRALPNMAASPPHPVLTFIFGLKRELPNFKPYDFQRQRTIQHLVWTKLSAAVATSLLDVAAFSKKTRRRRRIWKKKKKKSRKKWVWEQRKGTVSSEGEVWQAAGYGDSGDCLDVIGNISIIIRKAQRIPKKPQPNRAG